LLVVVQFLKEAKDGNGRQNAVVVGLLHLAPAAKLAARLAVAAAVVSAAAASSYADLSPV
jgi:hypothetical protein